MSMTIEIDHIGLSVEDYERAKAFYAAAYAPLRMGIVMEFPGEKAGEPAACGIGADGKPFLWLSGEGRTVPHVHICIRAETRAQVDAFHKAALAAGGKDNGAPGLRPHYHANYYGAFVLDPEGHNVEACCHNPE
jgi:catechol 2,3-dioxygenase-like lactoylglutathione lyase family enzyme